MVTANVEVQKYSFTVDQYHKMGEDNILHEDSRVELIEGEIITMTPIGRKHASKGTKIGKFFERLLANDVIVWHQYPIQLGDYSEPQPDLSLLKYRDDYYEERLPTQEDVYLIIEISDSSYPLDSKVKQKLYAKFEIPEYWIVKLENDTLEVYKNPSLEGYTEKQIYHKEDHITLLSFPNIQISIKDLIG